MTDARGLQQPLGIETVHWSAGTGSDLLVRVAGRWRRRRAATTVPAVLAIDTENQRYRFPAQPEPPSVRGAQPGVWQVGFIVPAALAPYLAGRLTLILGSVSIPLPPAVADPGGAPVPGGNVTTIPEGPEPIVLTDRRSRHAERAGNEAEQRLVDRLELELADAEREGERLRMELELAERRRREAEQLAHSEASMRLDLERDHDARIRRHQADARAVLELLQAVQLHSRDLAHEIETLRRSADEAGESVRTPGSRARSSALAAELAIARSAPRAPVPAVMAPSSEGPGLALELAMHRILRAGRGQPRSIGGEREHALAGALLRLAADRAHADEVVPRGLVPDLARGRARAAYVTEAIEGIARQLDAVRAVVALLPPVGADQAPSAMPGAGRRPSAHRHAPGPPDGGVAPDRLAAALSRLREELPALESEAASEGLTADAPDPAARRNGAAELAAALEVSTSAAPSPAPPPPTGRWLLPALKRLLREDAAAVGRVVIHLLPAQALAPGGAIRYDIAVTGAGCRAVTVTHGEVRLAVLTAPRELGEVAFRIEGDLEALGRLVLYGRLRRRLSRRVARVHGDRSRLVWLDCLIREPLDLHELYAAGVRLDPELAWLLVAHMIDPSWTAGERFTVCHESPHGGGRVYLLVRDGARARVSRQPPLGPVATTIRCPDEQLLTVLAGGSAANDAVRGAGAPVTLLRRWIARAQRDS